MNLRGVAAALLLGCGARSELSTTSPAPERLACGLTTVRARAGRGVTLLASVPPNLAGPVRWSVVEGPSPAQIDSTGADRARFWTDVEGTYRVRAESDGRAGVERCEVTVDVRGTAPGATCPFESTATASTAVPLRAIAVSASPIARDRWVLEGAPPGSARPPARRDQRFGATFVPDVVGEYVLRFEVTDEQGEQDQCVTRVHAVPGPGLRVELWWNPPGRQCPSAAEASCDRADLDLHLLRQPSARGWGSDDDCYFANCNGAAGLTLAWGRDGAGDDPTLLRDDVSGHGPEVVSLPSPTDAAYRVGVHYFDPRGADAQTASLMVYCAGAVTSFGPVTLPASGLRGGAFWPVAEVTPGDAGCAVRALQADASSALEAWEDVAGDARP